VGTVLKCECNVAGGGQLTEGAGGGDDAPNIWWQNIKVGKAACCTITLPHLLFVVHHTRILL